MNFTITQRRWLADNFKDALVSLEVQGEPYFKRLGSNVQAIMREAVQFTVLYKPLKSEIREEEYEENGKLLTRENITIWIYVYQPGTNDKIRLERTISKSLLDVQ